jgi:hypothetical protein
VPQNVETWKDKGGSWLKATLSYTIRFTSVLSLMRISLGRISGAALLSATLATVVAGRRAAAAALGRPVHVEADVRFMQGMIRHHAQALDMTVFNAQHQPQVVWEPTVAVARAYLDQLMRHDAILADRATGVAGVLDRLERLGNAPEQTVLLTEMEQTVLDLERDSRVSVAGKRPTDRSRLRSLAETLRSLAGSMR